MVVYNETFLCTALPDSVAGTKIRVAVLVSPRLTSDAGTDAALDNWPDARDWPSIEPTWQVTVQQGGTTAVLPATEVKTAPYDLASWRQMFPATSTTMPYVANDKAKAPIFSYPVKKVLETVRALHTTVLSGHRTSFPSLASLEHMTGFQALKQAADPDFAMEVMKSQGGNPAADSSRSIAASFAMADMFHGVRPGSQFVPPPPPAPHITSISPTSVGTNQGGADFTVTGSNFRAGAEVLFGANAGKSIVVESATVIKGKVPDGPANTTVNVVVKIGDQTSNSVSFEYGPQGPKRAD